MDMRIGVLGSTGSIGVQTLEVARHLGLRVVSLAVRSNIELLEEQIREFKPEVVAVYDLDKALELKGKFPGVRIVGGQEGVVEAACCADGVMCAMGGFAGVVPTIEAIKAGKKIFLANKEVLVAAGELVMGLARNCGVEIIPVDSEHSALFQCLEGKRLEEVSRLVLTASGGPLFHYTKEQLAEVSVEQALQHPNWKMGAKITVDSSTFMNKGLEVIEAHHLFGMPVDKIEVIVHPQSVIHSMVEMVDGSMFAQMSAPSMKFPIQYAITYPRRAPGLLEPFSFVKYPKLEFLPVDAGRFPSLGLVYAALREGGSYPCFLNAANEVLVSRFLQKQIGWQDIVGKLEQLLERHTKAPALSLETILAVDHLARQEALTI